MQTPSQPDDPATAKAILRAERGLEWPTLLLLAATYGLWALGTLLWQVPLLSVLLVAVAIAQFSSLQHEVLHGHPFRSQAVNDLMVFPGLLPMVPYMRFKDTHLQHHYDPALTDPYDDPESNYLDPAVWERLSRPVRKILRWNNTLLGRMLLGPAIGTVLFVTSDLALIRGGDRRVLLSWAWHAVGVGLVLVWLLWVGMPVWAYLLAAYMAYGLLKIRTYLEHRAHTAFRARTVVVEDRGPLAFLFLNNNFHVVHHMHPAVPWYRLPALYAARRGHFLRRNEAYVYSSYAEIFRRHFLKAKDPVPHPVWPVKRED